MFAVVFGTMVVCVVLAVVVIVFAVVFGTMVVIDVLAVVVIVFAVVFADVGFLYVEPICVFSM